MNTENLLHTVRRGIAGWREGASPNAGEPAGLGLSSVDAEDNGSKLSWGGWLAIAAMVGLLVVSAVYALNIWNSVDAAMTGWGWGMLVLGVLTTAGLGSGLMFLVFYSARHDLDR